MSLTDEDPRYNRYSFPTKLISYLAAGLPVIGLGHPQSTIIRAVKENRIGLSLTTLDAMSLQAELLNGLGGKRDEPPDETPWARFGRNVIGYGRREFDAQKMRASLRERFASGAMAANLDA
ncbi:MAG TPA: glycosyltransferase family 4 protein [Verrucomicrobia bacterium]|nr:glycosyltransferase family 4 protein [Verrucomicrobiota bacterium]